MPLISHQEGKRGGGGVYAKEKEETDGDEAEEDTDGFGVEPRCPIPVRHGGPPSWKKCRTSEVRRKPSPKLGASDLI